MASTDKVFPSCALFDLANQENWRVPPLRDATDMLIIFALAGSQHNNRVVNIASIADLTGISRATATRRVRHLMENDIVTGQRNHNCTLVTLTARGAALAGELVTKLGCPVRICGTRNSGS